MKRILVLALLVLFAGPAVRGVRAQQSRRFVPVTDAMLKKPDASDWLMWRRTYNGWGYSPLDPINKTNVKNLQPAWTWSMTTGATETTPRFSRFR